MSSTAGAEGGTAGNDGGRNDRACAASGAGGTPHQGGPGMHPACALKGWGGPLGAGQLGPRGGWREMGGDHKPPRRIPRCPGPEMAGEAPRLSWGGVESEP